MTENVNVRRVCLDALVLVMEDKKFLNEVLGDTLSKYQYLEKNKRSYISRMLRGTVERYIELDDCVSAYSSQSVSVGTHDAAGERHLCVLHAQFRG